MVAHRLKKTVHNAKNGRIQESASDGKTLKSPLPPKPKPTSFWQRLHLGWNNLSFRSKLVILLVGSATLPVVVVTQGLVTINKEHSLSELKESLQKDGKAFAQEYVLWTQVENQTKAENLAKLVQATELNLSNPVEVSARRDLLENFLKIENGLDPEVNKNFQILTDAQGKTVAQNIQILDQDSSNKPPLPALDKALTEPKYRLVSLPIGIDLGDIPIVENALSTGRPLSGIELLRREPLQRLGLAKQADIGLRTQPTQNLPESKQPFSEGTYDLDGGKAGLTSIAVYPIKINNKLVGTVIVGAILNRNYGLVDKFSQNYNVPVATVFAQDWRVSTNVPYTDGQTRAIGTRVAREVAEVVLNQGQDFNGQTNIVGKEYLTFYTPLYDHQKELNPAQAKPVGIAFIGRDLEEVENHLRNQQLIAYGIGGSMLLVIGLIAIPVAGSFAHPLRRLTNFAQQVAAGKQGVRLEVSERQDEIGVLSQELNAMAASIETNLEARRQEAERTQLFADIAASRAREFQELEPVFNKAVQSAREILKADRVVVYRFNPDWSGYIAAESVVSGWPQALADKIEDSCIGSELIEAYRKGRVVPTNNVSETNYSPEHMKLLERLEIKASLVTPILQNNQLFGLLIAHHCSEPYDWQQSEINFLTQLAVGLGLILDRVAFLEQLSTAKEQLQQRALELLMQVEPISKGDLTIRASVTADEIGTIADSYNATVGNLRKLVTQVQAAATLVAATTSSNELSIQELSAQALQQTQEITTALDRIQEMSNSIGAVAASAQRAEAAVQQATQTVKAGDAAMNRTVEGIVAIKETVAETSTKLQQLGESSQKISKVVNLIGTFAAQTNLLALKASIEAARAGEEGRGFAVLADEVRSLARQSQAATAEIESLVAAIQTETNSVVAAMQAGTQQVAEGTHLVEQTRQSLNQIATVSAEIGALVSAIASNAVTQSQASGAVTQAMNDVAAIAQRTSTEASVVSASFEELLAVATQLQANVDRFKVS